MLFNIWIENVERSTFLVKNAIAKSVLDQMTGKLHSPVICVQRNVLCTVLCDKIIRNIKVKC